MTKYRGKYKKCRTCKHVEEIGMSVVFVYESCPNKITIPSGLRSLYTSDKQRCEECKYWELKE